MTDAAGPVEPAPSSLDGARVVLGVTGGIAAYKAVEICRRLVDAGAEVAPVLTDAAQRFVGVATFAALAPQRPRTSLWDPEDPIPHTHLGQSADVVVVAPATARLIGAYRAGISDDLLTATLLATEAPVVLAPAMHTEMWHHPAVVDNLAVLAHRGVTVVAPATGRLAGGDVGEGRLADPPTVVASVAAALGGTPAGGDLDGLAVVITAGGTREPIDPVRYVGNRSSGKQGHALAETAHRRGAEVRLITTTDRAVPRGMSVSRVGTAAEMEAAVAAARDGADVVVMAAAVADFRPASAAPTKLKKSQGTPDIRLEATPDILAALGDTRRPGETLVGFAAETDDVAANARAKLVDKGIDLVVANDVSEPGAGFAHDTNRVRIVTADRMDHDGALADKAAVADSVWDAVVAYRARRPAVTRSRSQQTENTADQSPTTEEHHP